MLGTIPSNFQFVDEYYTPYTRDELESRWQRFLKEDAGNGRYFEGSTKGVGRSLIFENGAIWSDRQGRVRGSLEGTPEYANHRRRFIELKQNAFDKLKREHHRRYTDLQKKIKQMGNLINEWPERTEAEIKLEIREANRMARNIEFLEEELEQILEPERTLEWDDARIKALGEKRRFENQGRSAELLKELEDAPSLVAAEPEEPDLMQEMIDGNATLTPLE